MSVGSAGPAGGAAAAAPAGGDAGAGGDDKKEEDSKYRHINTSFLAKMQWLLTGVFYRVIREGRRRGRRRHRHGRYVRRRRLLRQSIWNTR